MKKINLLFGFCLLFFSATAQIVTEESPISTRPEIKQWIAARSLSFERMETQPIDLKKLREEDEKEKSLGVPPRFGYPIPVKLGLNNSGTWVTLANGDKIWRLGIQSEGALSINLLYDKFWIPDGAKFFVYSEDQKQSIGAVTAINNKGDRNDPEGFATGLIYGESITLEYYLPNDVKDEGVISIASVVHGYRYIQLDEFTTQDFGNSGNCQVNVNCAEGSNWQQEKNAVALILVNGFRICTGIVG